MDFDPRWMRMAAVMANAIITKLILLVGGYFLGAFLDRKFGTTPYLTLTVMLIAIGLGLAWLIVVAKRVKL